MSFDELESAFGTAPPGPAAATSPDMPMPAPGRPGPAAAGPARTTRRPSWPAVVATTVRLWLRRRGAALGRLFRHRRVIALTVLAVTALVVTGLIISVSRHAGAAPAASRKAARRAC